jgi:hypothetical protein
MAKYLQIKYRNSCDYAGSIFQNSFNYVMYLDVTPDKPVIELIEEGIEDGDKSFIPTFKRYSKRYRFNTVVPEYKLDALMSVMMHDTVYVKLINEEADRVFNFKCEAGEWVDKGMIEVVVSFNTTYDIVSGCCNNEQIIYTPCYQCTNMRVVNWIPNTSGIFTTPITFSVPDRAIYLVATNGINSENNDLYIYRNKGGWSKQTGGKDQVICFTLSGIAYHFLWDGRYWQPTNFIRSAVNVAGNVTVKCWVYPNCFAQLYKSFNGGAYTAVGSPVNGSTIQNAGVVSACAAGTNAFKVLIYNNNCNYGYTNIVTVTV